MAKKYQFDSLTPKVTLVESNLRQGHVGKVKILTWTEAITGEFIRIAVR